MKKTCHKIKNFRQAAAAILLPAAVLLSSAVAAVGAAGSAAPKGACYVQISQIELNCLNNKIKKAELISKAYESAYDVREIVRKKACDENTRLRKLLQEKNSEVKKLTCKLAEAEKREAKKAAECGSLSASMQVSREELGRMCERADRTESALRELVDSIVSDGYPDEGRVPPASDQERGDELLLAAKQAALAVQNLKRITRAGCALAEENADTLAATLREHDRLALELEEVSAGMLSASLEAVRGSTPNSL